MLEIPNTIIFDNVPQFVSDRLKQSVERWVITHNKSSPIYLQSNKVAERAVQTGQRLMQKTSTTTPHSVLTLVHRLQKGTRQQNDDLDACCIAWAL